MDKCSLQTLTFKRGLLDGFLFIFIFFFSVLLKLYRSVMMVMIRWLAHSVDNNITLLCTAAAGAAD